MQEEKKILKGNMGNTIKQEMSLSTNPEVKHANKGKFKRMGGVSPFDNPKIIEMFSMLLGYRDSEGKPLDVLGKSDEYIIDLYNKLFPE